MFFDITATVSVHFTKSLSISYFHFVDLVFSPKEKAR